MGDRRPTAFDPERWAALLVVIGAALLCAGTALLPGSWGLLAVPGVLLLGLACVSARDGFLLLGPFVKAELVRYTRRVRLHLWVVIAPVVCGAAVVVLHYVATEGSDRPTPSQLTDIASGGYLYIGWHLFLFTFILTTANLSNALVEDRESKRADFLLATDLRGREIVVGRSLARLAAVLVYPAAVMPIVAALPLLFRVDPALIGVSLGYCAVTIFSVAGLCGVASVLAADKKASGRISVLFIMPYIMLGAALRYLESYPAVWFFPGSPKQPAAVSVEDLVAVVNTGNPFVRIYGWIAAGSGDLGPVFRDLPGYAAFHLTVGVLAFAVAARWVRPSSAKIADTPATTGDDKSRRPPVGDRPVFWKEVYLHPLMAPARRYPGRMRAAGGLLVWGPAAVFALAGVSDLFGYKQQVQFFGRVYPAIWGWIGTVSAARFALESLPRERERDALVSLLVTPLGAERIAGERIWGVLRLCWGVPLSVLILAVASAVGGGLPWLGVPAVLLAAVVYMTEMAAVGGLCGATAPTLKASNARFGLLFAGLLLAPLLVGGLTLGLTGWNMSPLRFAWVTVVMPVGLMSSAAADQMPPGEEPLWVIGFLGGLAVHAAFAAWAWRAAVRRFAASTDPGREAGPMLVNEERR